MWTFVEVIQYPIKIQIEQLFEDLKKGVTLMVKCKGGRMKVTITSTKNKKSKNLPSNGDDG